MNHITCFFWEVSCLLLLNQYLVWSWNNFFIVHSFDVSCREAPFRIGSRSDVWNWWKVWKWILDISWPFRSAAIKNGQSPTYCLGKFYRHGVLRDISLSLYTHRCVISWRTGCCSLLFNTVNFFMSCAGPQRLHGTSPEFNFDQKRLLVLKHWCLKGWFSKNENSFIIYSCCSKPGVHFPKALLANHGREFRFYQHSSASLCFLKP